MSTINLDSNSKYVSINPMLSEEKSIYINTKSYDIGFDTNNDLEIGDKKETIS